MTHWLYGSVSTGHLSAMPNSCSTNSTSSSEVCGRDPVDHGRRERDVGVDPAGEARVLQRGERHQRGPRRRGVVGDVVAAEHRERRGARTAAQIQRLGQVAPRRCRSCPSRDEVGPHVGVVRVELAGDRVEEVPVAGDGQADHAGAGVGQRGADRRAVVGRVVDGADRTDHAGGLALMSTLDDGVQPVLGRQHVLDIGGAQADAGDTPLRWKCPRRRGRRSRRPGGRGGSCRRRCERRRVAATLRS